jgi:hypothetical protein
MATRDFRNCMGFIATGVTAVKRKRKFLHFCFARPISDLGIGRPENKSLRLHEGQFVCGEYFTR